MPRKKESKSKGQSDVPAVSAVLAGLAEQVVLADIDDLPAMAAICTALGGMADQLPDVVFDSGVSCPDAARKASLLVQGIILGDSSDKDGDFKQVCKIVADLQTAVCSGKVGDGTEGKQRSEVGGPSFAKATEGKQRSEVGSQKTEGGGLPEGIDKDLFEPFLEQQESVLPDIEAEILGYETDSNVEHLAALKRMIHTMKGEAGVCGIKDVEKLCHKLEDYIAGGIEKGDGSLSLDLLFKVKDCLESIIAGYRQGRVTDCAEKLIGEMAGGGATADRRPQTEDQGGQKTEDLKGKGEESGGSGQRSEVRGGTEDGRQKTEDQREQKYEAIDIADKELAADFVTESQEHFDIADENLLKLEENPADKDAVNAVFRAFHTIKGVSGFIGLKPIGDLAHVAETLLDDVRKDKRSFAGSVVEVVFEGLDMLKMLMADLAGALTNGTSFKAKPELGGVIVRLKAVLAGEEIRGEDHRPKTIDHRPGEGGQAEDSRADGDAVRQVKGQGGEEKGEGEGTGKVGIKQTMKVDADKIELLLDTIGELVIAQSVVAGDPDLMSLKSQRLEKNLSHLSKITRSLQDMGMAMRMVPIEPTFRKMARLVRDLSKKSGKEIDFVMEGAETELDKSMVEKLGDPLVHMVRNSVDHGIEPNVEDRIKAGKKPAGRVVLRAFHKSGSINIEIEDDGRGLDREAIVAKGIEKGLIASGAGMSDQDVYSLIFQPGFSTAKQITEVSGRGVGMDVVNKNIESLRGNVLIKSEPGKGTLFTIVLPLTMAIIDGMSVGVGDEVYIIPTLSIIESLRPSPEMVSTVVGRGEVIKFRDRLLPVFRLSRLFEVKGAEAEATEALAVIVDDSGKQVAVIVDELIGQQQTVIKSLGSAMGRVGGISGASILADGRPGLILDISGIVKMAMSGEESQ